jgi:hypothetical protein
MDNYGKGEANYIFGNPIGSFAYSVVSGLFGFSLVDEGKTFRCSPAFPSEWDTADFQLPYGSISYRKSVEGSIIKAIYRISSVPARKLEFSVLIDSKTIMDINCADSCGEKKLITEFGKKKVLFVSSEISNSVEIEIKYLAQENTANRKIKKLSTSDSCTINSELLETIDKSRIEPLDLKKYCNSEKIRAISGWRNEDLLIDLSKYEKSDGKIEFEGIPFKVIKNAASAADGVRMVLLEHSKSHPYTGKTIISDYPHSIGISIGNNVKGLILLYASECQSRQTGINVGEILLNYDSGVVKRIPLNVGKNIDTLFSHFAEETIPIDISSSMQSHPGQPGTDYINILVIPCNSEMFLSNVEFDIELPDVQLGLFGISLIL